jgi:NAD(P)-dependent dehydrogenase (short-subunit alcohol dehydrogenase family)
VSGSELESLAGIAMLTDFSLEGRRALCVGAGRGIGKGIAVTLAEAGADVGITSLNGANAQAVAALVEGHGRRGTAFQVDATNEESMVRLASQVADRFGDIDILVNCVGDSFRRPIIPLPNGPAGETSFADWRHIVDLNLTPAFLACRAFGPRFLERGSGSVINITTYVQGRGRFASAAYDSAKQALNQFTRNLALEWAARRIRVNAIGPGNYPDPEQRSPEDLAAARRDLAARVPLGREGYFRDVGLLAVYLASDAAAYVTGQVFVVDGGLGLV